jgi:hypothetical protein
MTTGAELLGDALPRHLRQDRQNSDEAWSLTGADVLTSPLSGRRKIVDLIVSYTNRDIDFPEKFVSAAI